MMTYRLIRLGSLLAMVLPLSWLYRGAALVARLIALGRPEAYDSARANIAQVLKLSPFCPEVRRAATNALVTQALNYVDLMRFASMSSDDVASSMVHGDLGQFTETLSEGAGVIIVCAHLGNVDFAGQWLAHNKYATHALMEHLRPERLYSLVMRQRTARGLTMYPAEMRSLAPLTEALRRGETVALAADRDLTRGGIGVMFFGAEATLPVGPALLALKTGAPIVVASALRLPDRRLYIQVEPAIRPVRHGRLRDDLRALTQTIAGSLETIIARAPDQWVVFEPVWCHTSSDEEAA